MAFSLIYIFIYVILFMMIEYIHTYKYIIAIFRQPIRKTLDDNFVIFGPIHIK